MAVIRESGGFLLPHFLDTLTLGCRQFFRKTQLWGHFYWYSPKKISPKYITYDLINKKIHYITVTTAAFDRGVMPKWRAPLEKVTRL